LDLSTPLQFVKGIGPARAEMFASRGLETVLDLLYYVPFRYEDRRNIKDLRSLVPGEKATVLARVENSRLSGYKQRILGLFEATVSDGVGTLQARWFHGKYLEGQLTPGVRVALFGKVEFDRSAASPVMIQPEYEILPEGEEDEGIHTGRVVPIYEAVGKVSRKFLRVLLHRILHEVAMPSDALPELIRERLGFPGLAAALRDVHEPGPDADLRLLNEFRSPAQIRLIFDEFFWLECGLALKRSKARKAEGIAFTVTARAREQVKQMLPFKPTAAQRRVIQEIVDDMKQPFPMNRLLQGDVGSGKTIVAAQAAVIAIENGYQVAVLAPTEILATQHFAYFRRLMEPLGYVVAPLTGSMSPGEKQRLKIAVSQGFAHLLIGTHALLESNVNFHKLGLAIVDEQHRFGVVQRLSLMEKGRKPDVLVMTATPIPRTLALTLYGDLEISTIDQLPPGRKPITTRHFTDAHIEKVWSLVAKEIAAGRQAYVVYPVIEESETNAMKAAQKAHLQLSQVVFPNVSVGLLHGKMSTDDKEATMQRFQKGETKILVSTTVIEVGVDVPNASVIVIEQAERFGLAQIHQLRGRVGRGTHQSYCFLVTERMNDVARERIRTLVDSNDGFYIADMDMRLRGPGEFFGTRQSGIPGLRVAHLFRDADILEQARNEAQVLVNNPENSGTLREVVRYIQEHWQRQYGLVQVG
jgi:ATP-dependent DNA helicase RecG